MRAVPRGDAYAIALAVELERVRERERLLEHQASLYAEELRELYEHQRKPERRLKEAASRVRAVLREGGLRMVFQPIVELESGLVVGVEALARFDSIPRMGPQEWFADAAAGGLAVELEMAAMKQALSQLDETPPGVYIGVNLSPDTVLSPEFVHAFDFVPADRVLIEITEHAPIDDYDALAAALASFRARGGRLAVDDAGAGFASLRHILSLSPDVIKLDLSLVRGLDADRSRRALAEALISFANGIGASIVAEGIETADELQALRALGVRLGQGYYLGRPGSLPIPAIVPSIRAVPSGSRRGRRS